MILGLLILAVVSLLLYLKWINTFWHRKGLPFVRPLLLFGNMAETFFQKKSISEKTLELYNEIKSQDTKHGGFFYLMVPFYMPIDPEIIKCILLRDFDHFTDRGSYHNDEVEPLTASLLNLEGAKWKSLRAKVTPVFTSSKMKVMFHTMLDCANDLKAILEEEASKQKPVGAKTIFARFTIDVIGSCVFGLDCHCMQNPDTDFEKYGRRFFQRSIFENMSIDLCNTLPKRLVNRLGLLSINPYVSRFFTNIVKETVHYRETNSIKRDDFVDLLLQIKHQKSDDPKNTVSLTDNEFAGQCFIFFAAGFETSSTLLTFAFLELAKEENQYIQEKLRKEINMVLEKHENQLTYDGVMEMTYLDKVVYETLRRHTPAAVNQRVCTKAYRIPDTNITLNKGIKVWIPTVGIHMDPKYYPNPEQFDPERFNEENRNSRPGLTWQPFGKGPRNCIGERFALLQSKLGLITVLRNFVITLNEKTKCPLKLSPKNFIAEVEGEVWLNIRKL